MCSSAGSHGWFQLHFILVPRAHDPSGLWQGSRALAGPNFLSMRRVFVSNSQPIRFARFDNKSVNRGLPVLDQTRALDPCHRPEGSWALGTRMASFQCVLVFSLAECEQLVLLVFSGCFSNFSGCLGAAHAASLLATVCLRSPPPSLFSFLPLILSVLTGAWNGGSWLGCGDLPAMGAVVYLGAGWPQWKPLDIPGTHLPFSDAAG